MLHHYNLKWLMLSGLLLALAACTASSANRNVNGDPLQTTSAPPLAPALTATAQPTPSIVPPTATVPATAVPLPTKSDLAQLEALIRGQLPTDQAISPDQPMGVSVLPLTTTASLSPLYAAYGSAFNLGSDARPVLLLYTFAAGQWDEVKKLNLDNADYLSNDSVKQVMIEPSHIWLEVQSGAGAHSGCYDLIAFDPVNRSVSQQISHCNSSPGAGHIADVNGDGQPDVVLDQTDYYVFCYACGVTHPQYSVLAWDGKQLKEVALSLLSDSSPAELQPLNNEAVRLAQAGLWKDAQAKIDQAKALKADNPVVRWNAALIALHAQADQAQVQAQTYPLLNNLFYGDYPAALNVLRPYPPQQIFSRSSPLIKGTMAEDWESALAGWITQTTNSAVQVQPNLAAAYFLRGWGEYLANAKDPAALQDVELAAQLAPDDKLFSDSVKFLK